MERTPVPRKYTTDGAGGDRVPLSNLVPYTFEGRGIRVVEVNGEPWFVAADVCAALGRSRRVLSLLDEDEKGSTKMLTLGGAQELVIVNEAGLYALAFRSRSPAAKRFRKWIMGEVIPSIRKTGQYQVRPPLAETMTSREKLGMVAEARRLFGPEEARYVWLQLGMPYPEQSPAKDARSDDALMQRVAEFASSREDFAISDVMAHLSLPPDEAIRSTIAAMLRHLGFESLPKRFPGNRHERLYRRRTH